MVLGLRHSSYSIMKLIFYIFMLTPMTILAQEDKTSKIFPYPLDFMKERISMQFDANERAFFEDYNGAIYLLPGNVSKVEQLTTKEYKKFMAFPLVRANKFYVFYGIYKIAQPLLNSITPVSVILEEDNPALKRYALLPLEQRANDFYLWSPDAPYWYSEHEQNGRPLPFHSFFILHLTSLNENTTEVEVIEDKPTIMLGKRLSVDANGKVQQYHIAPALPTTADRAYLLSCITQFIERNVPGRHWFSCRSQ